MDIGKQLSNYFQLELGLERVKEFQNKVNSAEQNEYELKKRSKYQGFECIEHLQKKSGNRDIKISDRDKIG